MHCKNIGLNCLCYRKCICRCNGHRIISAFFSSHELQTCDWPRNVGCDGLELSASPAAAAVSSSTSSRGRERERERERDRERDREEPRTRYTPPPPPPQPAAVVTSRGQPRQLQSKQEFIKVSEN